MFVSKSWLQTNICGHLFSPFYFIIDEQETAHYEISSLTSISCSFWLENFGHGIMEFFFPFKNLRHDGGMVSIKQSGQEKTTSPTASRGQTSGAWISQTLGWFGHLVGAVQFRAPISFDHEGFFYVRAWVVAGFSFRSRPFFVYLWFTRTQHEDEKEVAPGMLESVLVGNGVSFFFPFLFFWMFCC